MITPFKNWDNEFIGFANSGGNPDNYKDFNSSPELMLGYGGGPPIDHYIKKNNINLNPLEKPIVINSDKHYLEDPEKDNKINDYSPEDSGYIHPYFNKDHINVIKSLLNIANVGDSKYYNVVYNYTNNSFNLNNTLINCYRNDEEPPIIIKANEDEESEIDIRELDQLIQQNRLPENITVYSGLHFNPLQHIGEIALLPAYLSTSLSPHVSKDFGVITYNIDREFNRCSVRNILRLHLPKGFPHLFADPSSIFPVQGELILPRNTKMELGQQPTHIIKGTFNNHFFDKPTKELISYHIWTGRILS